MFNNRRIFVIYKPKTTVVKSPASVIGSALVRPEDHTKWDNPLLDAFGILDAMSKPQVYSPGMWGQQDSESANVGDAGLPSGKVKLKLFCFVWVPLHWPNRGLLICCDLFSLNRVNWQLQNGGARGLKTRAYNRYNSTVSCACLVNRILYIATSCTSLSLKINWQNLSKYHLSRYQPICQFRGV